MEDLLELVGDLRTDARDQERLAAQAWGDGLAGDERAKVTAQLWEVAHRIGRDLGRLLAIVDPEDSDR